MSHKSANNVSTNLELQYQLTSMQHNLSDICKQIENLIKREISGNQTVCKNIVKKVNNCSVTKQASEKILIESHQMVVRLGCLRGW